MEMPVDREDFDFEVFETDDVTRDKKPKRLCPQCSSAVTGRPNKIFCTPNCRKRHSEPTRNSYSSPTKRRENRDFFDRDLRLGEELYAVPPTQDILSNYVLLHPHPYYDTHLFPKHSRAYCTIAQAASNYCKKFWKADVKLVVYNRVPQPYDGVVR